MKKGILISLEGGEGSGKSTQAKKVKKYFEKFGYRVRIVQEPGETKIGNKIRQILLDPVNREMNPRTEVFLYMSARAQLVSEIIIPAINKGQVIICDRYLDSSMAYQGYGRKLGFEIVDALNKIAIRGYLPDLTFYLDLSPQTGLIRKRKSTGGKMDRMEQQSRDFHSRIRQGYLKLAKRESDRIKVISAGQPAEKIWDKIKIELDKFYSFRKTRKN